MGDDGEESARGMGETGPDADKKARRRSSERERGRQMAGDDEIDKAGPSDRQQTYSKRRVRERRRQ
jgi:hypothetical protein